MCKSRIYNLETAQSKMATLRQTSNTWVFVIIFNASFIVDCTAIACNCILIMLSMEGD